ncbi:hypothetical protein SAMN04489724_0865 [Algoriphagus locisalis]|uniref:Uncharacterized protein n=1 Tax=Algoriphagus locisalis TaxID=305507 RepID=A0A1I6Y8E2_9BACT|nr:hypothetical protein SAMN04489724_0865 [Algoriphagus locisalis]
MWQSQKDTGKWILILKNFSKVKKSCSPKTDKFSEITARGLSHETSGWVSFPMPAKRISAVGMAHV